MTRKPPLDAVPRCGGDDAGPDPAAAPVTPGAFFPETCHPRLSRRALLAGAAALAATSVSGRAAAAAADGTSIIRQHATDLGDPWAVAHGIRAMGRGFTTQGGHRAVDGLLELSVRTIQANGTSVLGIPVEVEVHPNSFLKTLLEAGVPPGYEFSHEGARRTLSEVVEGARALLRPREVASRPNLLPWSIIALTLTTSPLRPRWSNAWGETVDLDALVEGALRMLERGSLPLAAARRARKPLDARAPVHSFTCGGTHLLYSVLVALDTGFRGVDRAERVRQQVDLLVWRLWADLDLIDRFYRERKGQARPAVEFWYQADTRLKLLGHAEECLAFGISRGVITLTPGQQEQRAEAALVLRKTLQDLEGRDLREAKAIDRELYRQIVGDTCHARRGLSLAAAAASEKSS
jgi:hypothetical protein